MDTETAPYRPIHEGHNVKRMREILGIKQEALAQKLNLSQQTVSRLEAKEVLEDDWMKKIAEALNVSEEAIRNFKEEAAINYINNFNEKIETVTNSAVGGSNIHYTFNPIEKIVELYERIVTLEREKSALLEEKIKKEK